jgi:hypothetical protein
MWSVPRLYNKVPRTVESGVQEISVESTRMRMEHVLVMGEVGRLAVALQLIVIVKKCQ